jgi:hypothetical protein
LFASFKGEEIQGAVHGLENGNTCNMTNIEWENFPLFAVA